MTIESLQRGTATVLRLTGKLDLTTVVSFRQKFNELTTPDSTVIIDLSEITFVDSSGLSGLVAARERTPDTVLLNARPSVLSIMKLTNLTAYFTMISPEEFEERFPA